MSTDPAIPTILTGPLNLVQFSPMATFAIAASLFYNCVINDATVTTGIHTLSAIFTVLIFITLSILYREDSSTFARPKDPSTIYSPATGTILAIDTTPTHYNIIIFLSVFDTHIQYAPVNSTVISLTYDNHGRHAIADTLSKSTNNEKMIITLTSPTFGNIVVRQIAGVFARRIVTTLHVNQTISSGDRIGMIKLSSRVDIDIPRTTPDGKKINLLANLNDKVIARSTPLASISI